MITSSGGKRARRPETHDVPNLGASRDLESTAAGALSRPTRSRNGSKARGGGFGRLNGFLALDALLHRTSLANGGTGDSECVRPDPRSVRSYVVRFVCGLREGQPMYPKIEPFATGMLEVGDGNQVYWETCGNPAGKAAVVMHGGPGSGATPWWRRLFDPATYRIVLFDQRGCGRSRPSAADPLTDLERNTTPRLIADIESLRSHLGIERWLVLGGSWGSTLALAYAEEHPDRVTEMVLFSVVTTSRREVEWITRDMGRLFPVEWARFRDAVPKAERDGNLVEAYARLLADSNPVVRDKAARDWCDWEDAHVRVRPDQPPDSRYDDPAFRMCFARLVTHYWRHAAWLPDGTLLEGTTRLDGIPAVLVHGRLDVSSPLDIPWRLQQRWPSSELIIVDESGHAPTLGMTETIVAATNRFARLPSRRSQWMDCVPFPFGVSTRARRRARTRGGFPVRVIARDVALTVSPLSSSCRMGATPRPHPTLAKAGTCEVSSLESPTRSFRGDPCMPRCTIVGGSRDPRTLLPPATRLKSGTHYRPKRSHDEVRTWAVVLQPDRAGDGGSGGDAGLPPIRSRPDRGLRPYRCDARVNSDSGGLAPSRGRDDDSRRNVQGVQSGHFGDSNRLNRS
jgi:proline iminopeptidase